MKASLRRIFRQRDLRHKKEKRWGKNVPGIGVTVFFFSPLLKKDTEVIKQHKWSLTAVLAEPRFNSSSARFLGIRALRVQVLGKRCEKYNHHITCRTTHGEFGQFPTFREVYS